MVRLTHRQGGTVPARAVHHEIVDDLIPFETSFDIAAVVQSSYGSN
jgi:hypothetical protein